MESANNMSYLVAAYTAVWIVVAVYLFTLLRRNKRLNDMVTLLERRIENLEGKKGSHAPQ